MKKLIKKLILTSTLICSNAFAVLPTNTVSSAGDRVVFADGANGDIFIDDGAGNYTKTNVVDLITSNALQVTELDSELKLSTIVTNINFATDGSGSYATGAEGDLANTALQPADNISDLTNDAGYIDAITATNITVNNSVQPLDNVSDLTNDAGYIDAVTATNITVNNSVQAGDNVSDLTNDAGYIDAVTATNIVTANALSLTSIDAESKLSTIVTNINFATDGSGSYATGAEGDLANTALQSADIGVTVQAHDAVLDATTASFLIADESKLDGIEASATADQTGAEIKSLYEAEANAFTDAQFTKLAGVETLADVTDTDNVTSAGALMDSEVTNLAQVKAFSSADYATSAQGTTADSALQPGDNLNATNLVGIVSTNNLPPEALGDNLGDHTATQDLDLDGNNIITKPFSSLSITTGFDLFLSGLSGDLRFGSGGTFSMDADFYQFVFRANNGGGYDNFFVLNGNGTATLSSNLTVNASHYIGERTNADADVAGKGQLWVKDATPNQLWFTDDAGTDTQLGVPSALATTALQPADIDTSAELATIVTDETGTGPLVFGTQPTITYHTQTITATSDTLITSDRFVHVDDDTAGSTVTINLPAVSGNAGLTYYIKKTGSTANVVIDGSGAETIDGSTSATLTAQYESLHIVCDGTEWWIH